MVADAATSLALPGRAGATGEAAAPLHDMSRWPIQRRWSIVGTERSLEVSSDGLLEYRAACLIGSAGLGKTFELDHLVDVEHRAGRDVRKVRAAELAHSAEALERGLERLVSAPTSETVVYVDALDEAMVPVKQTALVVASWLRSRIAGTQISLRLSCRSAVFPETLRNAISEIYGEQVVALAALQPLTLEDVSAIAAHVGLDSAEFLRQVERSRIEPLATTPLTLSMLLRIARVGGRLPTSRSDLFAQAVRLLATERAERMEDGTALDMSVDELLDAAERLSAFALFAGVETIDYGDQRLDGALSVHVLGALPGGLRPLNALTLRGLRLTGLCERGGPTTFRFAHRQLAEYLAARRIARLLPHQAKSLLASPLGAAHGVAGPLRETAAFVATLNGSIADWVTEGDPEVIGMSDLVDDGLRRRAALNVLDRLRRHELTDSQLWREALEVEGLRYDGAEVDLRPVLRERAAESSDVVHGAIWFIDRWQLGSLSEDLADVVVDSAASLDVRISAGYALMRFGTPAARRRLLPLIYGVADDVNDDLKGIALRSNYPDVIDARTLLQVLSRPRRSNYGGAYSSFLYQLYQEHFDAGECLVDGLTWATPLFTTGVFLSDPLVRIARRMCRAAFHRLDEPLIAAALANTLIEAARNYSPSPLAPEQDLSLEAEPENGHETQRADVNPRRRLFEALVNEDPTDADLWWVIGEVPGFLNAADLDWATREATREDASADVRTRYADLARLLRRLQTAPVIAEEHAPPAPQPPEAVEVPPELFVFLQRAETEEPRFFHALIRILKMSGTDRHHVEFNRFLTQSYGWQVIDDDTRARIVTAAQRLLFEETEEPEGLLLESFNSIRVGYMDAAWLVLERDLSWLEARSNEWWDLWAWYFMRESHPNLIGESNELKRSLLMLTQSRAPVTVRSAFCRLVQTPADGAMDLLEGLFQLFIDCADAQLDQDLCDLISTGAVPADRVGPVARFILARDAQRGLTACFQMIAGDAGLGDGSAIAAAVALLSQRVEDSVEEVERFMGRRPDLAPAILQGFARRSDGTRLTVPVAERLAPLLIEFFPFEHDPDHDGAHWVSPDDSARTLRDRLLSWLGAQRDIAAVEALRKLEREFGGRYPWLRRPRASAERAYALSQWIPLSPVTLAEIFNAADKRLMRSSSDVASGIAEAIGQYETALRHAAPSPLEDLWNRPRGAAPSPKEEERVSDKICEVIRAYFREHAIAADREVQVHRRLISTRAGGNPGSELDVLVTVPAAAAQTREPIRVPVEVKLANNLEARTGMRDQLFGRYMSQLGADAGIFVVAWMDAPGIETHHRPIWVSVQDARDELDLQAADIRSGSPARLTLLPIVIDASLN